MSPGTMAEILGLALLAPLVYLPLKKRQAERSLRRFLANGFVRRATLPLALVTIPDAGQFRCSEAFDGTLENGRAVIVILGAWSRGTVAVHGAGAAVVQRIGGLLLPSPPAPALTRAVAGDPLLATPVAGGTLFLWRDLPTGASLARHCRDLSAALAAA